MTTEITADEIIDALGGTSETARLFEIEPPSVSGWRKDGIPKSRLMFLKLARPDIFKKRAARTRSPRKVSAGPP